MNAPLLRELGRVDYAPTFTAMQEFTAARGADAPDELWLCEHPPVFTQGLSGKPEHLLADIGIPVVQIDRGGQITYHGPGQAVIYLLLDLRRRGYSSGARARPASMSAPRRSPRWACASSTAAAITASRSTSTWTFRPTPRSTPAAMRAWP